MPVVGPQVGPKGKANFLLQKPSEVATCPVLSFKWSGKKNRETGGADETSQIVQAFLVIKMIAF